MSIKIIFLPWDSKFFGIKVGKIDFSSAENKLVFKKFEELIRQSGYDLIYIYSDISLRPFSCWKNMDSELVDTQVYLKMIMPKVQLSEYELVTNDNLLNYAKIDGLYKISDDIVPASRFSYDPKISKKRVIELYRKMIQNSLNCSFGDGLILEIGYDREIKGLFVLGTGKNIGKELLIGVKKSYRGKGIGRILFNRGLNYWKDKGVREIRTVVSAKNLNSLNFHLKLGYNISKIKKVYHLWLNS